MGLANLVTLAACAAIFRFRMKFRTKWCPHETSRATLSSFWACRIGAYGTGIQHCHAQPFHTHTTLPCAIPSFRFLSMAYIAERWFHCIPWIGGVVRRKDRKGKPTAIEASARVVQRAPCVHCPCGLGDGGIYQCTAFAQSRAESRRAARHWRAMLQG